jgi:tRNA(Ile)-lysidine synthase
MHIAQQRRIIRKAVNMVKGDLRRINFFHIDSAVGLIKSKSDHGNIDFPNRVRAQRTGETLIFSKEKSALRDLEIKSGQSEKITFNYEIEHPKSLLIKEINTYMSFAEMSYENMPDFSRAGQRTAFFDKYKLNFPLTVRNFRSGDRFRPLGMIGTQKVKKYFIDKKIPRTERYRCPILLSQGKIIWVVGHRIDESVKVMPSTRKVLKVELFLA